MTDARSDVVRLRFRASTPRGSSEFFALSISVPSVGSVSSEFLVFLQLCAVLNVWFALLTVPPSTHGKFFKVVHAEKESPVCERNSAFEPASEMFVL